jgi:hypothetical protein
MLISGAASKLRSAWPKTQGDTSEGKKGIANKYRSVALALAVFAVVGTAPFAQSSGTWSAGISTRNGLPFVHAPSTRNNGLSAFAQVPATGHQRATDYYNMVPSSLGPADRFGGASQP